MASDGYVVPQHSALNGTYVDVGEFGFDESEEKESEDSGPKFDMKSMVSGMTSFDTSVQRPNPHMKTSLPSKTFYADTDEKREPYARKFDEQGKMRNADGSALNTIGADRPAAIGAKGDRHIFAMDGQGQIYTADAIKENVERGKKAQESGESTQERFHHSSFLGGEDVAGAGEMQVRDGQVELVSDTSGHYRPGSKQMMQAVQQLEKNNVPVEQLGVEFVGKSQGQGALQASAVELLGYQNHSPETAESQMRAMHGKKDQVLGEIKNAGQQAADGANLKPSQFKRQQAAAQASSASPATPRSSDDSYFYSAPSHDDEAVYVDIDEEAPYNNDAPQFVPEEDPYNNDLPGLVPEEDPYNNDLPELEHEEEEAPYNNDLSGLVPEEDPYYN